MCSGEQEITKSQHSTYELSGMLHNRTPVTHFFILLAQRKVWWDRELIKTSPFSISHIVYTDISLYTLGDFCEREIEVTWGFYEPYPLLILWSCVCKRLAWTMAGSSLPAVQFLDKTGWGSSLSVFDPARHWKQWSYDSSPWQCPATTPPQTTSLQDRRSQLFSSVNTQNCAIQNGHNNSFHSF